MFSRRREGLSDASLLGPFGVPTFVALGAALRTRPFVVPAGQLEALDAGSIPEREHLAAATDDALRCVVDILGSGRRAIGPAINWHRDFKSGREWPVAFFRDIEYSELDRNSDVKVAWDLSRLQWLLPCAQTYRIERDEALAAHAREVVESWIDANPYLGGVNWACTMEVALRVVSWSYLFFVFGESDAWQKESFLRKFLRCLFLHGRFCASHLELSDINGNHLTADLVGLVFAGYVFAGHPEARRWGRDGWEMLCVEIGAQTHPDGVNHEASTSYHRLNAELFFFAARFRVARGDSVPKDYLAHLARMALFIEAYSRPDGSSPWVGDADDARVLPFGGQTLEDHRYLAEIIRASWPDAQAAPGAATIGRQSSEAWWCGVPGGVKRTALPAVSCFDAGGFVVVRTKDWHLFCDAGPVGLRGRGGHGHNDALSFELATPDGPLVRDRGAYLYTADYIARNEFRSSNSHNAPVIDGCESNPIPDPLNLWRLQELADARFTSVDTDDSVVQIAATHVGYLRLDDPVDVTRYWTVEREHPVMMVRDVLVGRKGHRAEIGLVLSEAAAVMTSDAREVRVRLGDSEYRVTQVQPGWTMRLMRSTVSPSYGVALPTTLIQFASEWHGTATSELRIERMQRLHSTSAGDA